MATDPVQVIREVGKLSPLGQLLGGQQQTPAPIETKEPQPPQARSEQPDRTDFSKERAAASGRAGQIPTFLGVNGGMTPQQQLARLATIGTGGQFSSAARPMEGPFAGQGPADVAQQYFRDLAVQQFTDPQGMALMEESVPPIARQYVEQVVGRPLRADTPAHFLTQLFG